MNPMLPRTAFVLAGVFWSAQFVMAAEPPRAADITFFEEKIRPVLVQKCYACHSQQAKKLKGDLRLDSGQAILKGGKSGPAMVIGKPEQSLIIQAIQQIKKDFSMPPEDKLPPAVISDFEKWVRAGGVFPETTTVKTTAPAWWELIDEKKLQPKDAPIETVVDHYVAAKQRAEGVKPAELADEYSYVRRVTLDLSGRIPTTAEVTAFIGDRRPDKHAQLVDRLMATGSFIRHQAIELDWLLNSGQDKGLRGYLERSLKDARSWDAMFKDIILANQTEEKVKGASVFLKDRVKDLDQLTVDVSVSFFGINISCARCHDHPSVPAWKQDHYFGMKSFFSRTFENGDFFGERDYGQVSFKTTKGETKQARLLFLSGQILTEPEAKEPDKKAQADEKAQLEKLKKDKQPPASPAYSRRAQLLKAGLESDGNSYFARAIINRLWHRLFGHGLVMPLDQLHGLNTPSHPELLQWLARDLIAHQYDLRRTLRGLALSQSYARASQQRDFQRAAPAHFALAIPRALTPHQLGAALVIATQDTDAIQALKPEQLDSRLEQLEKAGHGWANTFERPDELFQVSVDEALFFSNNPRIRQDLLADGKGTLLDHLLRLKDTRAQIQAAWLAILCRLPDASEVQAMEAYCAARKDRLPEAWRQILWALLTSAEMRFNH